MELVTYGWIGACVVAPTISAVCVVVLFLFNVYKGQWKNVDHFLVGLTVQEIISSVLCFALSILNLLHNRNEQLCGLITGLWFAIRALQLVTLTSLAIDRALILKWPYQYRFSVRSLQITSHLVFVSFCCSSIALFAYSSRLDQPTIQSIINDLPSSGGVSSNLAYFDLFSNPLFGNDRYADKFGDRHAGDPATAGLDLTTPLSSLNREVGRRNYSLIHNRANDRLALPLRSAANADGQSAFSSSLLNSSPQSVYSSSTSHLSSSIPPPLTSSTNVPSSTVSMNLAGQQHAPLYRQQFSVCSLHPLFWQRTFNLAILALFVVLSIITVLCFIYVDCTRRCNQKRRLISHTNYYLSSSSNYLNKHKLTGVSILDGTHEFGNANSSRYQLKSTPSQLVSKSTSNLVQAVSNGNSPGNTNTTTTTCASDNPHLANLHHSHSGHSNHSQHSPNQSASPNNRSSLQPAASLSTIALGDELVQNHHSDKLSHPYDQAGDSMSALCSMIDHDLARSTDALASKDVSSKELARGLKDKRSKMHLLSKSQPSLLHNLQTKDSLDKKGSNLSVYSFDAELNDRKRRRRPRSDAKLNPLANQLSNQLKYSNQLALKSRLPMRSSSMITQNNQHLDEHEPFSMQSREDLFSRKYLRDHYKICDLRWSSVVTITSLCYAVNQAPTMVSLAFVIFAYKLLD